MLFRSVRRSRSCGASGRCRARSGSGIGEDRVECSGEVRAAVADHELDPMCLLAEVHQQVSGLLGRSTIRWGCKVTPRILMRRLACSITARTYAWVPSRRSAVKKSHATISSAWERRNSDHAGPRRRGAGSMPAFSRSPTLSMPRLVPPARPVLHGSCSSPTRGSRGPAGGLGP